MSQYTDAIALYNTDVKDEKIKTEVEKIIREKSTTNCNTDVYKKLYSCVDLTSLNATDNAATIVNLTRKVNTFDNEHPDLPNVAAICIYPNMVEIVRMELEVSDTSIAAVTGGFPSAQTFMEIKVAETALAVGDGANEIDVVLEIGKFLNDEYEEVCQNLLEIKDSCRGAKLKVILETGLLGNASNIKKAAILAIYSGADFIKTSTGKCSPAATLEAAYVMCQTIKEYYEKTGNKIGFKAAGGITTPQEAVGYYTIVETVLGEEWLNKDLFRIGASRLCDNLLTEILKK